YPAGSEGRQGAPHRARSHPRHPKELGLPAESQDGGPELGSRYRPRNRGASARASSVGGTSRPSALAVLRLITSSHFVGCSTGSSAGLAPLKILSTKAARSKLCALRDRNPAAQWSPALAIDMWEHHQPRGGISMKRRELTTLQVCCCRPATATETKACRR